MRPRTYIPVLLSMVFLLLLASCGGLGQQRSSTTTNSLLEFLHHVPDNETHRQWVTYGNGAAWFDVWNIKRPESGDLLKLESSYFNTPATIAMVLEGQTHPPQSLNTRYSIAEDQVGLLGFNLFVLDRYMEAGIPPDLVTVAEFSFDKAQIANSLTKLGYKSDTIDGGTLYSIRDDNEWDLQSPLRSIRAPFLNRILLTDGKMIIGSATEIVKNAQGANSGIFPSLAENATYVAMAQTLEGDVLSGLGEMLGVILINGSTLNESLNQRIQDMPGGQSGDYFRHPLPVFDLAGFATYQRDKTSFLTLVVVFSKHRDAQSAADILAERLQNYTSTATQEPFGDRWSVEKATASTINDLPVAIVAMRAEAAEFQGPLGNNLNVLTWSPLVLKQDVLFLKTDP